MKQSINFQEFTPAQKALFTKTWDKLGLSRINHKIINENGRRVRFDYCRPWTIGVCGFEFKISAQDLTNVQIIQECVKAWARHSINKIYTGVCKFFEALAKSGKKDETETAEQLEKAYQLINDCAILGCERIKDYVCSTVKQALDLDLEQPKTKTENKGFETYVRYSYLSTEQKELFKKIWNEKKYLNHDPSCQYDVFKYLEKLDSDIIAIVSPMDPEYKQMQIIVDAFYSKCLVTFARGYILKIERCFKYGFPYPDNTDIILAYVDKLASHLAKFEWNNLRIKLLNLALKIKTHEPQKFIVTFNKFNGTQKKLFNEIWAANDYYDDDLNRTFCYCFPWEWGNFKVSVNLDGCNTDYEKMTKIVDAYYSEYVCGLAFDMRQYLTDIAQGITLMPRNFNDRLRVTDRLIRDLDKFGFKDASEQLGKAKNDAKNLAMKLEFQSKKAN